MQRKKVIELVEPEEKVPSGFFMIKVGNSRLLFDGEGKKKPPAEVRTLKRPNKTARKPKRQP